MARFSYDRVVDAFSHPTILFAQHLNPSSQELKAFYWHQRALGLSCRFLASHMARQYIDNHDADGTPLADPSQGGGWAHALRPLFDGPVVACFTHRPLHDCKEALTAIHRHLRFELLAVRTEGHVLAASDVAPAFFQPAVPALGPASPARFMPRAQALGTVVGVLQGHVASVPRTLSQPGEVLQSHLTAWMGQREGTTQPSSSDTTS